MKYPAVEARTEKHLRELDVKLKLAKVYNEVDLPEQFFLEAGVKVPDAKKIDLLAARLTIFKYEHPTFWKSVLPVSSGIFCFSILATLFFKQPSEAFAVVWLSSAVVSLAASSTMKFFIYPLADGWDFFTRNAKSGLGFKK